MRLAAAAATAAPAATVAASAYDPATAPAAASPAHATRQKPEHQPAGYLPFGPAVTSGVVSADWRAGAASQLRRFACSAPRCGGAPDGAAGATPGTLGAGPPRTHSGPCIA